MTKEERFLITAHAEGGQSVSVGARTVSTSRRGSSPLVVGIYFRGTTRIDAPVKAALMEAVERIETETGLDPKDAQDAVDTVDRLREELSEPLPIAKRIRRFVENLAAISPSAADAVRECESIRTLLYRLISSGPAGFGNPGARGKD